MLNTFLTCIYIGLHEKETKECEAVFWRIEPSLTSKHGKWVQVDYRIIDYCTERGGGGESTLNSLIIPYTLYMCILFHVICTFNLSPQEV